MNTTYQVLLVSLCTWCVDESNAVLLCVELLVRALVITDTLFFVIGVLPGLMTLNEFVVSEHFFLPYIALPFLLDTAIHHEFTAQSGLTSLVMANDSECKSLFLHVSVFRA